MNPLVTNKEIQEYFSEFRPIIGYERFKDRRELLIIKFENLLSALATIAVGTHKINGNQVFVKESKREPVERLALQEEKAMVYLNGSGCKSNSNSRFICSLKLMVTNKEIQDYFSELDPLLATKDSRTTQI